MPSMQMGADLDLAGFFLLNFKPEPVASLPANAAANDGRVVFNTGDGRFYIGSGSTWHPMGQDVTALEGVTPAQLRDRATHSGSQPASSISDLAVVVKGYKISDFAAGDKAINLGGFKATGVADGTATTDAVNKQQLDAVAAIANAAATGIAVKSPVRVVSTTNITLSGLQTIETVTLVAGDRVLVVGQTTASANGIYVAASGAWVRSTDADQNGELAPGTLVTVTAGATNQDTLWGLISDAAITIGTTSQTWGKILSSTGEVTIAGNGIDKTGVTLSVKLAANSGLVVDGTGLRVDPTKTSRRFEAEVPAGTPPISITHNLNTKFVCVTVRRNADGRQVMVPNNNNGNLNAVFLEFGQASVASGEYSVLVES